MKKYFFSLLCVFMFAISVNAAVPNEIRYNGRLKSYQELVTGTKRMTFNLYYENGTTPIWSSGDVDVRVSSGFFSYDLKPVNIDWSKGGVWLELAVDGNKLDPREKLMTQPYSFHAVTAENGVPPGTVIAFAGSTTTIPTGYLLCNGASYSKNIYPDLFDAIGTIYGGNGNPDFNVPNFQGMFLRGAGSNAVTTTPGGTVTVTAAPLGTQQHDAIRNITGSTIFSGSYGPKAYNSVINSGVIVTTLAQGLTADGSTNEARVSRFDIDAARQVPIANENRPANYSVNYYIKY